MLAARPRAQPQVERCVGIKRAKQTLTYLAANQNRGEARCAPLWTERMRCTQRVAPRSMVARVLIVGRTRVQVEDADHLPHR